MTHFDRQSSTMMSTWTNVSPTAPGFYWFRDSSGVYVADVFQADGRLTVVLISLTKSGVVEHLLNTPIPLSHMEGEWSGPLMPP